MRDGSVRRAGRMKYVVFTFDGYGLPIALRLQEEGREVLVAVVEDASDTRSEMEGGVPPEPAEERDRRLSLYDGLVKKAPARQVLKQLQSEKRPRDTFVFFDLNHHFRFAEALMALGFHGNFPLACDYDLEIDRNRAKEFVETQYPKVRVAPKRPFKKIAEAKRFLKDNEDIWVLKGMEEGARTVVPDVDDPALAAGQIVEALEQHPEEYESAGFILELRIGNALELTPEKVWYDGEPVYTSMCIENKPLGAGNVGPMTDCAQDLLFRTEMDDRINAIAFPPVVEQMARERRGLFVWDASLYIDPRTGSVYFGEFCGNRHGYNTLYTEMALCGSAAGYFEAVARGENPHPEGGVAASIRLFNLHRDSSGRPLGGARIEYKERVERDLWLLDVRRERGRLVTAGYTDTLAVATGAGKTVSEAGRRAQRAVDEFSFEGAYHRPYFDLVSREYRSSILNRMDYGLSRGFYKAGFGIG